MKMNHFTQKNIFPYFLIYYLNILPPLAANKQVFEFSEPSKCKNNEYFNTVSFSCVQCDVNKNLKPSADRLRCICDKFNRRTLKDNHPIDAFYSLNTTKSANENNNCISCNNTTCECSTDEMQIDTNLNNTVVDRVCYFSCFDNTYPSLDRSKCFPCKNLDYNYYINYIYSKDYYYTQIQDYCSFKDASFDKQDPIVIYQVKFENENVDSYYFRNELEVAIYFCKIKNELACEHLSNMCVLSLYANNVACALFMQQQIAPIWLFYNKNETESELRSVQITQQYNLLSYNNNNSLNFIVATFSLHGTFKFIGKPNMPCNLLEHIKFGMNFKKKCKLTVKNLLTAEVEFITPYLTFVENGKTLMHSLPVLIKNINKNNEISTWQLVRKFFFIDNISGFKTLSNFSTNEIKRANELSVLRYMKSLNVIINVQTSKDRNKIFPPLLIIEYAELTNKQISKINEITLDYKVEFTLGDSTIDRNLKIIIGIFSGLAFILSGIKTWSYNKHHHTSFFNIYVLAWSFIYAMGSIGNVIILSLIIFCIYLFTIHKGQTVPYILLPGDINEETIKIFTILAFFFKFVEMIGFICQYWNFDIAFLDWEQPKSVYSQFKYDFPDNSVNKLHVNKFSKDKHKMTPSEIITAKRKKLLHQLHKQSSTDYFDKFYIADKYKTDFLSQYLGSNISIQEKNSSYHSFPISIWRTYFIANQWLRLQKERKISIIIQLVAVLCTYQVVQLYPRIFAIPELTSQSYNSSYNFVLYYTICILIYTSIYCIQWLISTALYQSCIINRIQEFVNLCSVANISVFILPFNYYGFYIHGRSVHGFADIDLPTLMNDLEKERKNLCAHKGLVPGTTQQTFILSLTPTFRNIFKKLLIPAKIKQKNVLKAHSVDTINWEHIYDNQVKLKQFLCKFVDHCLKEEDYIIKEQHFFEKLFNIPLFHNGEKSTFYIDNKYSFGQVLLYRNEWLLATFEISIFTFIIVLCEDCILAITITTLISILLITVTQYNNKRNLDNIVLDKTFLM